VVKKLGTFRDNLRWMKKIQDFNNKNSNFLNDGKMGTMKNIEFKMVDATITDTDIKKLKRALHHLELDVPRNEITQRVIDDIKELIEDFEIEMADNGKSYTV